MKRVSVITKRPGAKPVKTNISISLENLQKTVEGYIETVTIASDMCFICNGEGAINGLPLNFRFSNLTFYGTVILIGVNGDEFTDIPITFQDAKRLFPTMFKED